MSCQCDITGYAMCSIAGTEETFDFKCKNGFTKNKKNLWTHCIQQSTPDEAKKIIVETVKRALERAKYENINDYTVSLVIASNFFGNSFWEKKIANAEEENKFLISNIMHEFHVNGIIICASTACSSGGSAIVVACQLIDDHKSDMVIVLGYDFESEIPKNGMNRIGALSKTYIAPFSASRSGTDLSDGVGCIVIEREELARERNAYVFAKIIGYGVNSDAYNATSPDPSGQSLYYAMQDAIAMGGINRDKIIYVNAHGSGTKLNDILETNIIKKIFQRHAHKLFINSSKSIVGHTLGAAGVIECIITIMEMNKSIIHPTANYLDDDKMCDLDYCFKGEVYKEIEYALSNSIGFGGLNVCILFERGD